MSKQQEIREGIASIVQIITEGGEDGAELRVDDWDGDWADHIIEYLHSQGVVVKVDRELPELRTIPMNARETKEIKITIPSWWDDVSVVSYLGKIHQQDMLKAGYVAVESLVKIGK